MEEDSIMLGFRVD
ncbi:hypothetical protein OYC64_012563 [Pagothenia borchgrevinki]|uniref:Uncharacterized protein n=1 Tax=Pagothenia borchgrevinki TaxID=8213 RepID=A0ABD2GAX2_PAGBO